MSVLMMHTGKEWSGDSWYIPCAIADENATEVTWGQP